MSELPKGTVALTKVRLSYPALYKATDGGNKQAKPEDFKFSASFILDKRDNAAVIEAVKNAQRIVASDKWPTKWQEKGYFKGVLRQGVEKEDKDGYGPDCVFFNAKSKTKPLVLDVDNKPLPDNNTRVYAGCYVDVSIRLWVQDNEFGRAIRAELRIVRFNSDGEPFGDSAPVNAVAELGGPAYDPISNDAGNNGTDDLV
jgi:hypothetical protein